MMLEDAYHAVRDENDRLRAHLAVKEQQLLKMKAYAIGSLAIACMSAAIHLVSP